MLKVNQWAGIAIISGSEPAREGVRSGAGDVACAGLIAGKPAPTGFVVCTTVECITHPFWGWRSSLQVFAMCTNSEFTFDPCGSWLASDGGGSGDAGFVTSRLANAVIRQGLRSQQWR